MRGERLTQNHIIAVGLLTKDDLERLGETLTRLWPVKDAPNFEQLLEAIDEAEQHLEESRQGSAFRWMGYGAEQIRSKLKHNMLAVDTRRARFRPRTPLW